MKTIIYFLIVSLLLLPLTSVAYADHLRTPWFAQVSCTWIAYYPFYDCTQALIILIFDERNPPRYNVTSDRFIPQDPDEPALAYAYYNKDVPINATWFGKARIFDLIILGEAYNWYGVNDDPESHSTLWHEIRHIICSCNFHPEPET